MERFCSDCRNNPAAQPPYCKMTRLNLDSETKRRLQVLAEIAGQDPACYACKLVTDFLEKVR